MVDDYLAPLKISSMLDAAIRVGGEVVGVICHEHVGDPRTWALEEENFTGSIADLVALAFEAREFFGSGDRVVVLGFMRFKVHSTGKEWEADWAMAFTVRDGLITEWRVLFDMGAEAAAFQA